MSLKARNRLRRKRRSRQKPKRKGTSREHTARERPKRKPTSAAAEPTGIKRNNSRARQAEASLHTEASAFFVFAATVQTTTASPFCKTRPTFTMCKADALHSIHYGIFNPKNHQKYENLPLFPDYCLDKERKHCIFEAVEQAKAIIIHSSQKPYTYGTQNATAALRA